MPTFNEIYQKHLEPGLNIRLTNPELVQALEKYAFDNRKNGVPLTKDQAIEEILYFFLIANDGVYHSGDFLNYFTKQSKYHSE